VIVEGGWEDDDDHKAVCGGGSNNDEGNHGSRTSEGICASWQELKRKQEARVQD